jgi:Holliday junction DNA helicase RuvB
VEELSRIVMRGAGILSTSMTLDGAEEIARRSRGTPRIAGRLLRRVRDFAAVEGLDNIDAHAADRALLRLEVDTEGLDAMDRRYLACLAERYNGGPAGAEALAAALAEQRDVIEDVIEPFLIQQGFVLRTPRGRMLPPKGYQAIGITPPTKSGEGDLFN